jgi:hypothetical protein
VHFERGNINLVKTQVMVYFSLYGDDFPIEDVTEAMGIEPTNSIKRVMSLLDLLIQMLFQQRVGIEKKYSGTKYRLSRIL